MMALGGRNGGCRAGRRRAGCTAGTAWAWRRTRRPALCGTAGDACRHVPGAGGPAGLVLPQPRAQLRRRPRIPPGRRRSGAPGRRHRGARRALPAHPDSACRGRASVARPRRAHRRAQPAAGRWRSACCLPLPRSPCRGCGARMAARAGPGAGHHHRRAAHRRTGCADRSARGARLRRRGPHAGVRAGARGGAAGHAARTCGPHRAGQRRRLPVRPDGDPCHPDRGWHRSGRRGGCRIPCGGGVRGGRRDCRAPGFSPVMPPRPRIACWRPPRRRCRCRIHRIRARRRPASRSASKACISAGWRTGRRCSTGSRSTCRRAPASRCWDRRAPASRRSRRWH